jgi:DNA-binding MarR family transcriptional regulator
MIDHLIRLFDEVRLLEHRLVQSAELLHAGNDVTIPGRAVLEFLQRSGPTSVPDVARARYVTRQHIQTTVDALVARGLVEDRPNPAHRRSSLFALTDEGSRTIAAMRERERQFLERRLAAVDRSDVESAADLLATVRVALDEGGAR